jgi:hypothetical protein
MITKVMRVIQKSPIKPGPEGGDNIGWIYAGTVLVIEISKESPHDGWGHIVAPNPPINSDGTYLRTGKQGWIEMTHLGEVSETKSTIQIDINWEDKTWSAKEL